MYHYVIHKSTTLCIEFFENYTNVRSKVIKWLELCTKEDKNATSTILTTNSWDFFQTQSVTKNEIVLYVLLWIL